MVAAMSVQPSCFNKKQLTQWWMNQKKNPMQVWSESMEFKSLQVVTHHEMPIAMSRLHVTGGTVLNHVWTLVRAHWKCGEELINLKHKTWNWMWKTTCKSSGMTTHTTFDLVTNHCDELWLVESCHLCLIHSFWSHKCECSAHTHWQRITESMVEKLNMNIWSTTHEIRKRQMKLLTELMTIKPLFCHECATDVNQLRSCFWQLSHQIIHKGSLNQWLKNWTWTFGQQNMRSEKVKWNCWLNWWRSNHCFAMNVPQMSISWEAASSNCHTRFGQSPPSNVVKNWTIPTTKQEVGCEKQLANPVAWPHKPQLIWSQTIVMHCGWLKAVACVWSTRLDRTRPMKEWCKHALHKFCNKWFHQEQSIEIQQMGMNHTENESVISINWIQIVASCDTPWHAHCNVKIACHWWNSFESCVNIMLTHIEKWKLNQWLKNWTWTFGQQHIGSEMGKCNCWLHWWRSNLCFAMNVPPILISWEAASSDCHTKFGQSPLKMWWKNEQSEPQNRKLDVKNNLQIQWDDHTHHIWFGRKPLWCIVADWKLPPGITQDQWNNGENMHHTNGTTNDFIRNNQLKFNTWQITEKISILVNCHHTLCGWAAASSNWIGSRTTKKVVKSMKITPQIKNVNFLGMDWLCKASGVFSSMWTQSMRLKMMSSQKHAGCWGRCDASAKTCAVTSHTPPPLCTTRNKVHHVTWHEWKQKKHSKWHCVSFHEWIEMICNFQSATLTVSNSVWWHWWDVHDWIVSFGISANCAGQPAVENLEHN